MTNNWLITKHEIIAFSVPMLQNLLNVQHGHAKGSNFAAVLKRGLASTQRTLSEFDMNHGHAQKSVRRK